MTTAHRSAIVTRYFSELIKERIRSLPPKEDPEYGDTQLYLDGLLDAWGIDPAKAKVDLQSMTVRYTL